MSFSSPQTNSTYPKESKKNRKIVWLTVGLFIITIILVVVGVMRIFVAGTGQKNSAPISSGKKDIIANESSLLDDLDDIDEKLHIQGGIQIDPKIKVVKELKSVSLCGEAYKAKQIFFDGVDVVQRTTKLLKEEAQKEKWFCEILVGRSTDTGGKILPGEEIHITLLENDPYHYTVFLSLGRGLINLNSGLPHSWDFGVGIDIGGNNSVSALGVLLGPLKE